MERIFDRWIQALQNTPEESHCRKAFFEGKKACALGLLYRTALNNPDWQESPGIQFREDVGSRLMRELGIDYAQELDLEHYITMLNDYAHFTFREIADMLSNSESDLWKVVRLEMSALRFEGKYTSSK